MTYCNEKSKICEYANSSGYCSVTACLKHNQPYIVTTTTYANWCEICGHTTEDTYHHICAKCRLKLHDLLYNNSDWGNGSGV